MTTLLQERTNGINSSAGNLLQNNIFLHNFTQNTKGLPLKNLLSSNETPKNAAMNLIIKNKPFVNQLLQKIIQRDAKAESDNINSKIKTLFIALKNPKQKLNTSFYDSRNVKDEFIQHIKNNYKTLLIDECTQYLKQVRYDGSVEEMDDDELLEQLLDTLWYPFDEIDNDEEFEEKEQDDNGLENDDEGDDFDEEQEQENEIELDDNTENEELSVEGYEFYEQEGIDNSNESEEEKDEDIQLDWDLNEELDEELDEKEQENETEQNEEERSDLSDEK